MTAINLCAAKDAAWLLVDQAWMANGQLLWVGTKIAKSPRLRMAVAYHGRATNQTMTLLNKWLETVKDQETALSKLHRLLALIRMEAMMAPRSWIGAKTTNLFVAAWVEGRPKAWVVGDEIVKADKAQAPQSGTPLPEDHRDTGALIRCMQEQRGQQSLGCYNIGGAAELTVVTATGITSEIIHRWPDRLGEPIQP